MCSLMLGSMLHSLVTSAKISMAPPRLLIYTLCMASLCFAVPIVVRDERITFWCFCAFEVCCGIYFPSMAHQRERIIEDGMRARMYGIMRIPLNLFVVAVLATTKEGTNILSIPAQFSTLTVMKKLQVLLIEIWYLLFAAAFCCLQEL